MAIYERLSPSLTFFGITWLCFALLRVASFSFTSFFCFALLRVASAPLTPRFALVCFALLRFNSLCRKTKAVKPRCPEFHGGPIPRCFTRNKNSHMKIKRSVLFLVAVWLRIASLYIAVLSSSSIRFKHPGNKIN